MQCDRKTAQGGQKPSTQDRTNQGDGTQDNYLRIDVSPFLSEQQVAGDKAQVAAAGKAGAEVKVMVKPQKRPGKYSVP